MLRRPQTRDLLRQRALDAPPVRDFPGALRRADGRVAVIGEIKRRSPSKGDLAPDLDPAATAKSYEAGGAGALSVLTDAPYFSGRVDDLTAARQATELPVLRKDFTIDEVQVYESRAIGADAILLIAAAVTDDELLADLHSLARELGLDVSLLSARIDEIGGQHVGSLTLGIPGGEDAVTRTLAWLSQYQFSAERLGYVA